MRPGNSYCRYMLAVSAGPSNHKAQHSFIFEAVFAITMTVDPMDPIISVQPLPRTTVAIMVCQTAIQQRANSKIFCLLLLCCSALSLQDQYPQFINLFGPGNFDHCWRFSYNTKNYYRLFGSQIICSVSFGFGLLNVRLKFGAEGCYITT